MDCAIENELSVENVPLRLKILNYKVHEYYLQEAWRRFENAGFKPLLIKGWAAAQSYPEPNERRFNDADFIIAPREYREAVEFLKSYEGRYSIDLHYGARHLDNLSYENLYARSKSLKCGETTIRVLCPEDHLRVLCVHWLIDGGAKREKLWDIFYAVDNRPSDFDWDRCLNAAGPTRKKWIACTIGLAHKYLDLNLEDTPLAKDATSIPRWLIKAVEKEWRSDVELRSLHYLLGDKKELWRQIKKRIPPNPIQATVDMEGEFDNNPRILYQIGDIYLRFKNSLKRFLKVT
jgi:hypothetical protein